MAGVKKVVKLDEAVAVVARMPSALRREILIG
jgi:hypothetical protein